MIGNYRNDSRVKSRGAVSNWIKRTSLFLIVFIVAISPVFIGCGPTKSISGAEPLSTARTDIASKDYTQLKDQLNEYLSTQPGHFSIYFKDLNSGQKFAINGDEPITAASIIKAPAVLYLNTLIDQGKLNWNDRLTYNVPDYQGGSGILQFSASEGDTYSLRVLANLSITISDNIAYRMLLRHLGRENLADFMLGLGGKTVFPEGDNITTANDMGKYMEAILEFQKKNPEMGGRLLDDMANPIYHVGLPGKLDPRIKVAHKEGDVGGVANDVGIVFAAHPYILVVLSKDIGDIDQGFARIADISKIVYDYNN